MSVAILKSKDCDIKDLLSRSPEAQANPEAPGILKRWLTVSEEVWLGMHDDKVACIWGLVPPTTISNRAYMWLLTTDLVEKHKFLFVRHSQLVVESALERYEVIVGHVAIQNEAAKKWLRWLGAEFGEIEKGWFQFKIRRK
jgi:hypothetical protein